MLKMNVNKTNVARLLDKASIKYRLVPYEFDPDDLAATHVAQQLDEDIRRVFKTLVLETDRAGYIVCVVPGDAEVDLKKAARVSGAKRAAMLPMRELLPLTGYIRGGCSPVGMRKRFATFFHDTAVDFDTIFVSAGQRGLQIEVSPADLINYVGAQVCDLIKDQQDTTEDE